MASVAARGDPSSTRKTVVYQFGGTGILACPKKPAKAGMPVPPNSKLTRYPENE
jgi:hypothetical protein